MPKLNQDDVQFSSPTRYRGLQDNWIYGFVNAMQITIQGKRRFKCSIPWLP